MENEIWKDVTGYEGYYQVSNLGRVKSLRRMCNSNKNHTNRYLSERILSPNVISKGYFRVSLQKDGVKKRYIVSVLVARAFIPNPENKPQVDHIDNDKSNNCVSNLRWTTPKENANNPITRARRKEIMKGIFYPRLLHGYIDPKGEKSHSAKKVVRIDPNTKEVKLYGYIRGVAKDGFNPQCVSLCCRHKYKFHRGYIFMYESEYITKFPPSL